MLHWQSHAVTDTGKKRRLNEDSLFVNDSELVWAVADGMGGHHRGDYASQSVVSQLASYRYSRRTGVALARIEQLLRTANTELIEKAEAEDTGICASTVAILIAREQSILCTWVGDSRIYRFRDGELTQLTRDHNYQSLLADLQDTGVETPNDLVDSQALTRGVGAEDTLEPEHCRYSVQRGDRLLICTDGLYKEIPDRQLGKLYEQIPDDGELIDRLHQAYLANGARDNLGMVLLTAFDR
jgi:serine/threonine protein phosphatase PrpC